MRVWDPSTKRSGFSTNSQSRFASVALDAVTVSWDFYTYCSVPSFFSEVPKATHEASQGHMKGTMSSQKALKASEGVSGKNEREKTYSEKGLMIYPTGKSMISYLSGVPNTNPLLDGVGTPN